jgi:hypothetical protein
VLKQKKKKNQTKRQVSPRHTFFTILPHCTAAHNDKISFEIRTPLRPAMRGREGTFVTRNPELRPIATPVDAMVLLYQNNDNNLISFWFQVSQLKKPFRFSQSRQASRHYGIHVNLPYVTLVIRRERNLAYLYQKSA